jgi:hypothetical protein
MGQRTLKSEYRIESGIQIFISVLPQKYIIKPRFDDENGAIICKPATLKISVKNVPVWGNYPLPFASAH